MLHDRTCYRQRNGEHADASEGSGCNRKYLALCDISAQLAVRCGLQAVEGDVAGDDISFQSTLGHFLGKRPGHDHLILHAAGRKLLRVGIAAVEAHEGLIVIVRVLIVDRLLIHVIGHGVVDIQQSDNVLADTGADKLAQAAINIHFTGYGDSHTSETAVHIAGHKAELRLERGPAFSGDGHIFTVALMLRHPVFERDLILRQLCQNFRLFIARTKLLFHLLHNRRNPFVPRMLVEGFKQIKLRVLLDLHAQVIELFDRCVACQKVQRTRAEAYDFQAV